MKARWREGNGIQILVQMYLSGLGTFVPIHARAPSNVSRRLSTTLDDIPSLARFEAQPSNVQRDLWGLILEY